MAGRCDTPPTKGGDNSDTFADNSSKLGWSTNFNQVRFTDNSQHKGRRMG